MSNLVTKWNFFPISDANDENLENQSSDIDDVSTIVVEQDSELIEMQPLSPGTQEISWNNAGPLVARGLVSICSMGSADPINFERIVLEPINFWENSIEIQHFNINRP